METSANHAEEREVPPEEPAPGAAARGQEGQVLDGGLRSSQRRATASNRQSTSGHKDGGSSHRSQPAGQTCLAGRCVPPQSVCPKTQLLMAQTRRP